MEPAVLLIVVVVLFAVGWVLARRIRATRGTVGAPIPPGTAGVVQAPLAPAGTVLLAGEPWSARAVDDEHLDRGEPVRLVRIDGLTALVERAPSPQASEPVAAPPEPSTPPAPRSDRT